MPEIHAHLKARREATGLSQQELAQSVGVTRQALIAIEAGRQVPSTALALALGRTLGCRVEDLFALEDAAPVAVRLAPAMGPLQTSRLTLAYVDGECVAHRTPESAAADGILASKSAAKLWVDPAELQNHFLLAGCAPLLGVLAARANRFQRGGRFTWLGVNNTTALRYLRDGYAHIAGVHGNRPIISGKKNSVAVNLLRWRQGIVVAVGNPLKIKTPTDLMRAKIRFAWREEGSGAHGLLTHSLKAAKYPFQKIPAYNHADVVSLIGAGIADAGIAIENTATAAGLDFIPLADERFDLAIPENLLRHSAIERLISILTDPAFRHEAEASCCDMSTAGEIVKAA